MHLLSPNQLYLKVFLFIIEIINIDLPSLRHIILGRRALQGKKKKEECSLIMRGKIGNFYYLLFLDLPNLIDIKAIGKSFLYPRTVTLESSY